MAERQEAQLLVVALLGQQSGRILHLEQQVAMADHRPLGRPGGARGIDQDGEVVRLAQAELLRTEGRMVGSEIAAQLQQVGDARSEEHTSEHQSLMRISYAVFCS